MPSFMIAKPINAPTDRVFALITDFANAPRNMPAIKRVEMLTTGPVGVGTKFKETRIMWGKKATETMEVVEFQPGRSYTLGAESCGCNCRSRLEVRPQGSGSALEMNISFTPVTLLAKLVAPLSFFMMGACRKAMEADLESIRVNAESAA